MINSQSYKSTVVKAIAANLKLLESISNKTVIVTGATGLIGAAIADVLILLNDKFNCNVKIILAARNEKKVNELYGDLIDNEKILYIHYNLEQVLQFDDDIEVNYIIHTAGNAHPALYSKEPVETLTEGFIGLKNILEYARNAAVEKVLFLSSSEVYGEKADSDLYKENDYRYIDLLNVRACYPMMKRAGETLCKAYYEEYGIGTIIVRPGHIYGPTQTDYDSRASAQFLRNAVNKENIVLKSDGAQLRSYCHVLDCAIAIIVALLSGSIGEAYNISNKNSVISIRDFAAFCAEYARTKVVFEVATDVEKKGYNMMSCSALDATKIENLGWNAVLDARTGIFNTIECIEELMANR